jgi:hypothetical protein
MWSTENEQVLLKAFKIFDNFFLYFPEFFDNFIKPNRPFLRKVPVKISDFLNNRAKSYAGFKEGTSNYVFGGMT